MNAPPAEDHELWDSAQRGDRSTSTEPQRRHGAAVWTHANRPTASRTAAEDVPAGRFLTAWRRRGVAAAAVVAVVLGAAGTVALLQRAPTSLDPGVANGLPVPRENDPAKLVTGNSAEGAAEPLARCEAAAIASDLAVEYPPGGEWIETDRIPHIGVDNLIMINQSFLCHTSPATVSVSPVRGTRRGNVEIVRVSKDWLGVLNPYRAAVSWKIGDRASEPSTAPVLGMYLPGGVSPAVTLIITGAGPAGDQVGMPVPEPGAAAVVVTDRPLPARDRTTPAGIAFDECMRREMAPEYDRDSLNPQLAEDSESELWQPLARIDLPDGGFAISAVIGDSEAAGGPPFYAGICVANSDGTRNFDGQRQEPATAESPRLNWIGGRGAWVFAVPPEVVRVEAADPSYRSSCEVRERLALCPNRGGETTFTLVDAAGNSRQKEARAG